MQTILFVALCGLVAMPLAATLKRPVLSFEYPAFMAFAFAAFILPQAISLMRFPGSVQDESVTAVLTMACLCMGCCLAGYRLAPSRMAIRLASRPIDPERFFHVGIVFIVIGLAATATMSRIQVEYAEVTGGMTGTATLVLFFRQLAYPGFAIALFAALQRPTALRVMTCLAALYAPVLDVLIGRRENTAVLFLTVAMALYYERRIKPSRVAVFVVLVFSMLAIPATHQFRQYVGTDRLAEAAHLDLVGNFRTFLTEESALELRNGAAVIEAARDTGNFGLGRGYWNHLMFRYVPAQLVGVSAKEDLMFEGGGDQGESTEIGFRFARGTTVTGMGDAFGQFGWFGCLFFAFMAVLYKGMWQASLQPGALFARVLYVMTFTSGMRAVTHWTFDFLPGLFYFLIFLGLAGLYATSRRPQIHPRAAFRGHFRQPVALRAPGAVRHAYAHRK